MNCINIIARTAVVACLAMLTLASWAGATTVTPAGRTFTLRDTGAIRIEYPEAYWNIICDEMTGTGTIPAAPNNSTPDAYGSVVVPMAAPAFGSCSTSRGITTRATTYITFGNWTMTFTRSLSGTLVGVMTMPKAGLALEITSEFRCIITVANGANTPVFGPWDNGTGELVFEYQQAAVLRNGLICPRERPAVLIYGEFELDAEGAVDVA